MEAFIQALKSYQTFNPQGWVGIYRLLPMWAGIPAEAQERVVSVIREAAAVRA